MADRRFNKVAALESDFSINLRYPGQYFDAESNLHYNGWRTFDPKTGFYTQNDPLGLGGGWNRRSYVGGNPLSFTDPTGLQALPTPFGPLPLGPVPVQGGSPQSLDPENPYGSGAPGIAIPSLPRYTVPGLIHDLCKAISDRMFSDGRPAGVPENWVEAPSRDGKGTKWIDPSNPKGGDYVRVRGDGTVTQVKDGRALDANGNPAPGLSSPEAHFPTDRWQFRP